MQTFKVVVGSIVVGLTLLFLYLLFAGEGFGPIQW